MSPVTAVPAVEVDLLNLVKAEFDESAISTNVVPTYTRGRYDKQRQRAVAVIAFTAAPDNLAGGGLGPVGIVQLRAGATLVDIFTTKEVKDDAGVALGSNGLARKLRKEIEREINRIVGENHLAIAGLTHIEIAGSVPVEDRSADPIVMQQRVTVAHGWVNSNE